MNSNVLNKFFYKFKQKEYQLIYGAGGVASDFLTLCDQSLNMESTFVVVSKCERGKSLKGFAIHEFEEFVDKLDRCSILVATMGESVDSILKILKESGATDIHTVDEIIRLMYSEIWTNEIEKNKIFFSHFDGRHYGDNPKYILEKFLEKRNRDNRYDFDFVWVKESGRNYKLPEGVRSVEYGTYEYYYELGTACIWIDDKHKNFFSRKREGQFYYQTWHGGGPLKKIEWDAADTLSSSYLQLCEDNSKMIDMMVSPAKFNTLLYRRAFHYYGPVLECGYPRNTLFFGDNKRIYKNKIKENYGIEKECGILLFAPTLRSKGITDNKINFSQLLKSLEERFNKEFIVLIRLHPADLDKADTYFEWTSNIINASGYDDTQELMAGVDVMLTDYSSVMWDFGVSKKPVFLYHVDIKEYEAERGYYLSFDKMPYVESFSNEDLCEKISTFDNEKYLSELETFYKKYGCFDREDATDIIVEDIICHTL